MSTEVQTTTLQIGFDDFIVITWTCKLFLEIVALFALGFFFHLGLYYWLYTNL